MAIKIDGGGHRINRDATSYLITYCETYGDKKAVCEISEMMFFRHNRPPGRMDVLFWPTRFAFGEICNCGTKIGQNVIASNKVHIPKKTPILYGPYITKIENIEVYMSEYN